MPLGYYVVMRGWRIPVIVDNVLAKGWSELQAAVANGQAELVAQLLRADNLRKSKSLGEVAKPYKLSLLHLAVFSEKVRIREKLGRY